MDAWVHISGAIQTHVVIYAHRRTGGSVEYANIPGCGGIKVVVVVERLKSGARASSNLPFPSPGAAIRVQSRARDMPSALKTPEPRTDAMSSLNCGPGPRCIQGQDIHRAMLSHLPFSHALKSVARMLLIWLGSVVKIYEHEIVSLIRDYR